MHEFVKDVPRCVRGRYVRHVSGARAWLLHSVQGGAGHVRECFVRCASMENPSHRRPSAALI